MVLMNLLAQLTLDKSAFDADLSKAETDAKNFENPTAKDLTLNKENFDDALASAKKGSDDFKGVWDDLVVAVATSGITATIAGVISYLGSAVDTFMNAGQTINDTSKAWGISAEAYQEWAHVLSSSRADIKDFQGGITNINKLLGGDPTKKAAAAFETLGVSAQDANGDLKTTEQILDETITALANYEGNDRTSIVEAIFGSNGAKLNQMLDKGASGIRELKNEANDLGLVMSDQQIETALSYDQAISNLQDAMTSFQQSIGESIVPALQEVVEMMTRIVNFFSGSSGDSNGLENQLDNITEGLAGQSAEAETTAKKAKGLVDQLWSMGDATKLTAEQQEIWKGTASELIKLIPELDKKINLDTKEISGNKQEIYDTIDAWKAYEKELALAAAKEEAAQAVREAHTDYITAQTKANLAANEAEVARQNAIADINSILSKSGLTGIGEGSTLEDMQNMIEWLGQFEGAFFWEQEGIKDVVAGYQSTAESAENAANKAAKLKDEYTKADEEFDEYVSELEKVAAGEDAIDKTTEALSETEAQANAAKDAVNSLSSAVDTLQSKSPVTIGVESDLFDGEYNAKGNWSVPYDNFPAILHRGEQVLTASDARKYKENKSSGIDYSELATSIVVAVRAGMDDATVNSYLDGKNVTGGVSRRTVNQLKARRFAT